MYRDNDKFDVDLMSGSLRRTGDEIQCFTLNGIKNYRMCCPANVLPRRGYEVCFALAMRRDNSEATRSQLHQSGAIAGSLHYGSLETNLRDSLLIIRDESSKLWRSEFPLRRIVVLPRCNATEFRALDIYRFLTYRACCRVGVD